MWRQGRIAHVLGLALVVALVGGCGGAGTEPDALTIRSERPPTLLSDQQWPVNAFRLQGVGEIDCGTDTYRALLRGPSTRLQMHPGFQSCHLRNQKIRIDTRGCTYSLEPRRGGVSPMPISCAGEHVIKIVFPHGCALEIPSQTAPGGARFHNTGRGAGRTFDVSSNLRGVSYEGSAHERCGVPAGTDVSTAFQIELFSSEAGSGAHGRSVGAWIG